MDVRDYLRILRGRWRLIALCALLALAAAALATFASNRTYQATSQVFVSTTGANQDTTSGLQQGGQFAQQRVKSYADIVNSPPVTTRVISDLRLRTSPSELAKKITATAPLDTVLINIDVRNESPQVAQRIANAVAMRFTVVAASLETPQGSTTSPVKVSVVRQADLPNSPVSPRPKLNLALGLLVGLAIGVGAAVLRETLDTTIKGVDAVQDELGQPTLGVIAFDPDAAKRPLIVQNSPQSVRAEAFRQLRTNLQFVDVDHRPRSIVVTSSVPGEGKSTTACNLAIALAQAGLKVILVEADLRRPRLLNYLGLPGGAGVTDALVGRANLEDLLQPWGDTGNMLVLGSGPTPPNPSELLGSQQMRELLEEMEQHADLVLLDAPPLLPVTDAAVVTAVASGAILVVRAGSTRKEQAMRALEILRGVDAHVYGAVLNMAATRGPDAYRYGYYGGGYVSEPAGTVQGPTAPRRQLPPRGDGQRPARNGDSERNGVGLFRDNVGSSRVEPPEPARRRRA